MSPNSKKRRPCCSSTGTGRVSSGCTVFMRCFFLKRSFSQLWRNSSQWPRASVRILWTSSPIPQPQANLSNIKKEPSCPEVQVLMPKPLSKTPVEDPPKGLLTKPLWPFIVGLWGMIEGTWGVAPQYPIKPQTAHLKKSKKTQCQTALPQNKRNLTLKTKTTQPEHARVGIF